MLDGLPAWDDHGGGRLLVGPDRMLYLTRGDQGNNWLANACHAIRSQELPTAGEIRDRDWSKYQGKILRLNLDESIPGDNPVINGVRRGIATSRSVPMVSASTPVRTITGRRWATVGKPPACSQIQERSWSSPTLRSDMRVAALFDIHGNFPALEAVLADVHHPRVDRIVIGGDVLPGPMPRETLDLLRSLDIPADFIKEAELRS